MIRSIYKDTFARLQNYIIYYVMDYGPWPLEDIVLLENIQRDDVFNNKLLYCYTNVLSFFPIWPSNGLGILVISVTQ